jgi:hypothetical protein
VNIDKGYIVTIIIAILLIALAFFMGQCTKQCPKTVGQSQQVVVIDSPVVVKPVGFRIDTIRAIKKIYIPQEAEVDSAFIKLLIKQRDSIANILYLKSVQSLTILDTVIPPAMDSLYIEYNDFRNTWDSIKLGLAPRQFTIPVKTIYVNIPCPEKSWYETYWGRLIIDAGVLFVGYEVGKANGK